MAEIGIVASIVQIADAGLRLSLRLYTFGETVASADRTILSISKDVSLTSSVLQELGHILEKDKDAQISSENAMRTTEDIVQECLKIFQEIDGSLEKILSKIGLEGKAKARWTSAVIEKIKWPFLQPKMQLLRSNLDSLKATLLLMLNVMTYARQLSEKTHPDSQLENQRKLIEDLARSKENYTRKFEALTLAIEASSPVRGPGESHVIHGLAEPQRSPERSPSPFPRNHSSPAFDEVAHYGELINRLLEEINAVKHRMEPLLESRIWDDVIGTHRRETSRFRALYGRKVLQTTMTGLAWDVVKAEIEAEQSGTSSIDDEVRTLSRTLCGPAQDSSVSSEGASPLASPKAVGGIGFSRRDTVTSSPRGYLDWPCSSPARRAHRGPKENETEVARQVGTIPSTDHRGRSTSSIEVRSFIPSRSVSEGSSDRGEKMSRMSLLLGDDLGADFEVKEQDKWLPIASVARIMRTALPDNAMVSKEAKECMQECVSEFISFITSEAADLCNQERSKTMRGEEILRAMRCLDFEHYAKALEIYLVKYREAKNLSGAVRDERTEFAVASALALPQDIQDIEHGGDVDKDSTVPVQERPRAQNESKSDNDEREDKEIHNPDRKEPEIKKEAKDHHLQEKGRNTQPDRLAGPIADAEAYAPLSSPIATNRSKHDQGKYASIVDDLLAAWTTQSDVDRRKLM